MAGYFAVAERTVESAAAELDVVEILVADELLAVVELLVLAVVVELLAGFAQPEPPVGEMAVEFVDSESVLDQ